MPNITYILGGISFNAVPRKGQRSIGIKTRRHVTLGRKNLYALSIPGESLSLEGDYLTESKRAQFEALIEATESSGTKHIFDDDVSQRYAIIERFNCETIVGRSEAAYRFEMDLLLLGEVPS